MKELVSARRQVHRAHIILDQLGTRLGCEVHNGSRDGATLRPSKAAMLPSTFGLQLLDGGLLSCVVIRRSRLGVAVRFASA